MKRNIALLLAVCFLVLGLSACGGKENDWKYIEKKGELIIGITYFEPMNYLQDDGELTGFETEFAEAVCAKLGLTPKFQEISWSAKETELSAKNIDCIWNGMTINPEREKNMNISQSYMANKQVLIGKSENIADMDKSVEGKTIATEVESAGEAVCKEEEFFKDANIVATDTQAKAVMEVAAGTSDGCVIDYVTSLGMIGPGTDFAGLDRVESRVFADEQYGIAFRKGDDELLAKVNGAIDELRADGTLEKIAEKYNLQDLLL